MDKSNGMTLIELIIVITIIGILVVALGLSFVGWRGNYQIESQIRNIYSDLIEARTRAMTRNLTSFAVINPTDYRIYEDSNNNGTLEAPPADSLVWTNPKTVQYGYQLKMISAGSLPLTLTFDTRGLTSPCATPVYFGIDSASLNLTPDYDCISITQARIKMGKTDDKDKSKCNEK